MMKTRVVILDDVSSAIEAKPAPYDRAQLWLPKHDSGSTYEWLEIFMTREAYRQINKHAASTLDTEVGGMLVGQVYHSPAGLPYVVIEAQLEARYVKQGATYLTFTSDTLADALNRIDDQYPSKKIVGWYHTHPGLSVFLSSMDVWLHTNFFREMWQVALVIDPIAGNGGFFRYTENQPGHIHPQLPGGFYELMEPGNGSVVNWKNMEAATERWYHQQQVYGNPVEGC
jgi:proteasome lid subunit RPN8/RPN11